MTITIEQFVEQNIILCVSTLIYELTQKECFDEEIMIELWFGGIDYEAAEYQLEVEGCYPLEVPCPEDGNYCYRWGVRSTDSVWKIDPIHNDRETAIYEYFEEYLGGRLCEYRHEVMEHWVVSGYLAARLRQNGERVISLYGLKIWNRCCTGVSLKYDDVITKVHQDAINHSLIPDTFFD